jgi:hypothetical protein
VKPKSSLVLLFVFLGQIGQSGVRAQRRIAYFCSLTDLLASISSLASCQASTGSVCFFRFYAFLQKPK